MKKVSSRKSPMKREPSINDIINTETWSCVVVMAVERSVHDSFILKEFYEEAVKGIRKEVKVISYDHFILKLLHDFMTGEVRYKYAYLLHFASIFSEAGEYLKKKEEIPTVLLALVVKAILFYLKEESLMMMEMEKSGPPDPVEEMAKRPSEVEKAEKVEKFIKMKDVKKDTSEGRGKKMESALEKLKIRPPSSTKLETTLQRRGETDVKAEDKKIDDCPLNGCFRLYVLLIGFHQSEFPLELIKAGIPLYGILCIDTSRAEIRPEVSVHSSINRHQPFIPVRRTGEIRDFWDGFLKILWDPKECVYFKDTILQIYVPQSLLCEKQKLREFICREISFLMYDISDYKLLLDSYLKRMNIRDVKGPDVNKIKRRVFPELDSLPNENVTVPLVLQSIIDCVCGRDYEDISVQESYSSTTFDPESESTVKKRSTSCSVMNKSGSCELDHSWSQIIEEMGDPNFSRVYSKIKELDLKYQLDDPRDILTSKENENELESDSENDSSKSSPFHKKKTYGANMAEALNSQEEKFGAFWKKVNRMPIPRTFTATVDLCLYALLLAKVKCLYAPPDTRKYTPLSVYIEASSTFEMIKNITSEMRKPHFTLVDGTRSVIKLVPFNVKDSRRDFFTPSHLKVVTPENLKTCSAPQFFIHTNIVTEKFFFSQNDLEEKLMTTELTAFGDLRKFLQENLFEEVKDFDFVEELSKSKMVMRESRCWDEYNCVDFNYSVFLDALLFVLHNRKNSDGIHHEAFNQSLKTTVGLRDFYEYVLEDEDEWFKEQNFLEMHNRNTNKKPPTLDSSLRFSDSVFLIDRSIKKLERDRALAFKKEAHERKMSRDSHKGKMSDHSQRRISRSSRESDHIDITLLSTSTSESLGYVFEGYNVSNMAVQYSGLKTVYYTADCSVTVELLERLYSTQDLGIHIRQGGHTLHLYSYACPIPHISEPYTFHLTYKNGMFMAFGKRILEQFIEIDELVEAKIKSKKNAEDSSEPFLKTNINKKRISKTSEDPEFFYDMTLSLPNSLIVSVVRKIVKPCYIKQKYLIKSDSTMKSSLYENSRLFLPNGNVIIMMSDYTAQILKMDTSIIIADLYDIYQVPSKSHKRKHNTEDSFEELEEEEEEESMEGESERVKEKTGGVVRLESFEVLTPDGYLYNVDKRKKSPAKRLQIFKNNDYEFGTQYFRRSDGTNYMLLKDGSLCVEFKDGTKIMSTFFTVEDPDSKEAEKEQKVEVEEVEEEEEERTDDTTDETSEETTEGTTDIMSEDNSEETEGETTNRSSKEEEFVFVHYKITIEHPDYATVVFDSSTQNWKIILPFDSAVSVTEEGNYSVRIDRKTELEVQNKIFKMKRYSPTREVVCSAMVSLKSFDVTSQDYYIQVKDEKGRTFVVEPNANCYMLNDTLGSLLMMPKKITSKTYQPESQSLFSSEFSDKVKLKKDNKHFVVRRDISGLEIFHKERVNKILTKKEKGQIVFTMPLPGTENLRSFVLISPGAGKKKNNRKWSVPSILPNPKYEPIKKKKLFSSTYGIPPTWIHPLPKRKGKFEMPESLSCRVFTETIKTDLNPPVGEFNCSFCEYIGNVEENHTIIEPGWDNIQIFLRKLANDDQSILKEMYSLKAKEVLTEKFKGKPKPSAFLTQYLKKSKISLELQEYHKKCIKKHIVPNFFKSPHGIIWLIINGHLNKLLLKDLKSRSKDPKEEQPKSSTALSLTSASISSDDLEYNIKVRYAQSFSDLSCKTDLSSKTTPGAFTLGRSICRCKIRDPRIVASSPLVKTVTNELSDTAMYKFEKRPCTFTEKDFEILAKMNEKDVVGDEITLEDLMCMGLV